MNLSFFAILICVLVAKSLAKYDCTQGCALGGPPACGTDGIVYANECVAICQGVSVAKRHCRTSALGVSQGHVSLSTIERFHSDGFNFVAKYDPNEFSKHVSRPLVNESSSAASDVSSYTAVRMTLSGEEYVSTALPLSSPWSENTHANNREGSLGRDLRTLGVVGEDSRAAVPDTKQYPFRVIGEVDYGSSEGCTATLISRNTALTAGFCVFNYEEKAWMHLAGFSPGRYRSGANTVEPFGTWEVDYLTTFVGWTKLGLHNFNIAVLKIAPGTREEDGCMDWYPGDATGYAGIGQVDFDTDLNTTSFIGYMEAHGDQWTSGVCTNWEDAEEENFAFHYCDTALQSGASAMTVAFDAVGVDAYTYYDSNMRANKNGAVVIENERMFTVLYGWSERDIEHPECPAIINPCHCDKMKFFPKRLICRLLHPFRCSRHSHHH